MKADRGIEIIGEMGYVSIAMFYTVADDVVRY